MFKWPIDKWKKLSWRRKNCDSIRATDSWRRERRAYRKRLIADGTVKICSIGKGLHSIEVRGMCVHMWSFGETGREVIDVMFDTIMAMERK